MFDDQRSRRIGGLAIAVTLAAMAAVLTVDCGSLRPGIDATVYFGHPGALVEGADVVVAGEVIGRVRAVERVPAGAATALDHPLHPGGGVAVRIRLERRRASWVGPDCQFLVSTNGMIGEAYLGVLPPAAGGAPSRPLRDGDAARGIDPVRLEQVMVRSFENTAQFRRLLDDLAPAASALGAALGRLETSLAAVEDAAGAGSFTHLADAIGQARAEGERLAAILEASGVTRAGLAATVAAAGVAAERFGAALDRIGPAARALVDDLGRIRARLPPDLAARVAELEAKVAAASATVTALGRDGQALTADLAAGRGTIGSLLNDPEFMDDAKRLGKILKRQPWRVIGRDPDRPVDPDE